MKKINFDKGIAEMFRDKPSTKVCKIINGVFSWRIEVDGIQSLISNPDYFEKHYTNLGYIIERTKEEVNYNFNR